MSYNISQWKTKRLENLSLPIAAFYTSERTDWHPERSMPSNPDAGEVVLKCGCEQEIRGVLEAERLTIHEIDMQGEGSGYFYHEILEPALKQSRGYLEAVLIWEGGDSVSRLIVTDGELTNDEIDL